MKGFLLGLMLLAAGLFWALGIIVHISSSDMAPTLLSGDRVYALDGTFARRAPERGELVAFRLGVEGLRFRLAQRISQWLKRRTPNPVPPFGW